MTLPVGRVARSYPSWLEWPARLVPYRFRAAHRLWARVAGFFWKPCPLCGGMFGGHEWRDIDGKPSSVPDPARPPTGPFTSVCICPPCTRAGRGVHGWTASAVED